MADVDSQVQIEIKTTFDNGGTEAAAEGLGKVQEAAQNAAASSGELGTNLQSAETAAGAAAQIAGEIATGLGDAAQNANGAAEAAGALAGGLAAAGEAAGEIADNGGGAAQAIEQVGTAAQDAAPAADQMADKWSKVEEAIGNFKDRLPGLASALNVIFAAFAKGFEEVAKFNEEVRKVHETTIGLQDSLAAALGHDPRSAFEKRTAVMSRDELAEELERKKAERKDVAKGLPLTITEFEKSMVDADGLWGRVLKAMGKGGFEQFLKQNNTTMNNPMMKTLSAMTADETWGEMSDEEKKKAFEDVIKKEIGRVGEMTRQIEDLERRIGRYDERAKELSREEKLAGASSEEKERLRGEFLEEDIAELEARRESRAKDGKGLVAEDELRLRSLYNRRKARGGSRILPISGNEDGNLPGIGNPDGGFRGMGSGSSATDRQPSTSQPSTGESMAATMPLMEFLEQKRDEVSNPRGGRADGSADVAGSIRDFAQTAVQAITARDRELDELRAAQERLARELEQAKSQMQNLRN